MGVGTLCHGVLLVPVGAAVIVVDEEELLGRAVHAVEVEDAAVRYECLEPAFVLPGEVIYRVTAVACADASETVAVYPRFPGHVVDGAEVVADVLPL